MDLTQAVEHIRPSVVQISFSSRERRMHGPIGTGFFVSSEAHVITALHVVQRGSQIAAQGAAVTHVGLAMPNREYMRGNFVVLDFDTVLEDSRHDLALLKLRRNPFKGEVRSRVEIKGEEVPFLYGVPTLDSRRPKDGMAVAVSGYPLREAVLVTNAGWMATSWSFSIAARAEPIPGTLQWFRTFDVADVYLADVEINPGNSGAPVYSVEKASVIGVCVGSKAAPVRNQNDEHVRISGQELYYSSGLTNVVPIQYVLELLRQTQSET